MNLATASPAILALSCVFAGLLLIALGELFLAVRENTMNMRRTLTEEHRTSRYDYGGLHVVGWLHVGLAALLFGVGTFAFLFFLIKPVFRWRIGEGITGTRKNESEKGGKRSVEKGGAMIKKTDIDRLIAVNAQLQEILTPTPGNPLMDLVRCATTSPGRTAASLLCEELGRAVHYNGDYWQGLQNASIGLDKSKG